MPSFKLSNQRSIRERVLEKKAAEEQEKKKGGRPRSPRNKTHLGISVDPLLPFRQDTKKESHPLSKKAESSGRTSPSLFSFVKKRTKSSARTPSPQQELLQQGIVARKRKDYEDTLKRAPPRPISGSFSLNELIERESQQSSIAPPRLVACKSQIEEDNYQGLVNRSRSIFEQG